MSDVETAIKSILTGKLAAVIGTRVFPLTRGTCSTFPAVVYSRVSTAPAHTHDQPGGFAKARFQLDSYGSTFAQARSTANQVRQALSGGHNVAGQRLAALLVNELDGFEPETNIYRIMQDYMIGYQEVE